MARGLGKPHLFTEKDIEFGLAWRFRSYRLGNQNLFAKKETKFVAFEAHLKNIHCLIVNDLFTF